VGRAVSNLHVQADGNLPPDYSAGCQIYFVFVRPNFVYCNPTTLFDLVTLKKLADKFTVAKYVFCFVNVGFNWGDSTIIDRNLFKRGCGFVAAPLYIRGEFVD